MDEPIVVTKIARLGPWMDSGRLDGDPPHSPDHRSIYVPVYTIKATKDPSTVYAVEDYDGCQALVLGFEEDGNGQG